MPPVPAPAGPAKVAVPFPLSVKVTPDGSAPDSLSVESGNPLAMTVKRPGVPTTNVAAFVLVMAGASFTVRVKFWSTVPPVLVASKTSG